MRSVAGFKGSPVAWLIPEYVQTLAYRPQPVVAEKRVIPKFCGAMFALKLNVVFA
jgi:hypothetical protein